MTITLIHEFPPGLCRLLARKGRIGMTDKDLAKATGWTIQKLVHIYSQRSWEKVYVGDMEVLMAACGITEQSARTQRRFLHRTIHSRQPLSHLRLADRSTRRLLATLQSSGALASHR